MFNQLLNRLLFAPISDRDAQSFRRGFYLAVLPYLTVHYAFSNFIFPIEFFSPRGFFRLFPVPMPDVWLISIVYFLAAAALIGAAFKGWAVCKWAAFFGCFYIFGIRYNYGFLMKADAVTTIGLGVMAVAKSAAAWPIRFLSFYGVLIFFLAAIHKLVVDGWQWAASDSVAQVLKRQLFSEVQPASLPPLSNFIVESGFSQYLSWHTMGLELLSPLLLVNRTLFLIIFPQLVLMLLGFQWMIGRHFLFTMAPIGVAMIYLHRRKF